MKTVIINSSETSKMKPEEAEKLFNNYCLKCPHIRAYSAAKHNVPLIFEAQITCDGEFEECPFRHKQKQKEKRPK